MTGLLVLAVFALWIWGVLKLSRWLSARWATDRWRKPVTTLLFIAILPLPFADELLANLQLESLCREGAVMKIDEQRIKGRRVKVSYGSPFGVDVPDMILPVTFHEVVLRDTETGEVLGSRGRYRIKAGLLIRALGGFETGSPMFARSYCAPNDDIELAAKRIGFTIIK